MRRALLLISGLAFLVVGVAVFWPRASDISAETPRSSPEVPAALDFAPVSVSAVEQQGLTLTGRVLDGAGRPISGARVFLASSVQASLANVRCGECNELLLSCPAHETAHRIAELLGAEKGMLRAGAEARTDERGAFRFEHLAGVSFTVWAEALGFGLAGKERAAPGEPVELFLPPLRSIAGALKDDTGRPLSGAKVIAVSRRFPLPRTALSDSAGRFELKGLGEGPFFVLAQQAGFLPASAGQVEAGPTPIQLTLSRPRALEVHVRSGGREVDAKVRVSGDHLAREVTASHGLARFDLLHPDPVVVTATLGERSAAPRAVDLTELVTQVELELEPGATVLATVVDESGDSVPNPDLVLATRSGEIVTRRKARTGEATAFGPVGPGDYVLRGNADGYKAAELPIAVSGSQIAVELTLSRGTLIQGRVLDEYGRPAPGISILVTPTGDSVVAGPDGAFTAQVPSPGLYQLHAHHSDWGGGQVKVTAPASGVELHLEPRAGVEVTVLSEGRRVEGADVVLWVDREGSFRSDRPSGSDGIVLMRGMPAGSYWLLAGHADYLPSERQRINLEDGQLLRVTATLRPGARISGEVVDTNGTPVEGVAVSVVPRGAEPAATDGRGHFELKPLRPGMPYRVEARHPRYEQVERVIARAGGDAARLTLKRRDVFRGRVLGEGGRPMRHFRIDDHEVDSADGRFELPLSSTGDRVIFAIEAPAYEPMMVDRPATPDLGDFALVPAPAFSGVVRDETGAPVVDAVVTCDVCDESVLSGAGGKFRLGTPPYVPRYTVTARKGRMTGSRDASPGATGSLDITLKAAVRLSGIAYQSGGAPAVGVEIEGLSLDRAEPITIVTASDGSYAVEVPPGNYRFTLAADRSGPGAALGRADPVTVIAEVQGSEQRLDFGPAPGTSALTFRLHPAPGNALWVVRGDLSQVSNPPLELLRAAYGRMLYQPLYEQVTISGLLPGRYTVVWGGFHIESPGGPVFLKVDVPAQGEVNLVR